MSEVTNTEETETNQVGLCVLTWGTQFLMGYVPGRSQDRKAGWTAMKLDNKKIK